jgi:hypothetical protein
MSEEKPTFKITDRRLFNADGTPRPGAVREEPAAPEPAPTESTATARAATDDARTASTSTPPRDETRAASQPEARGAESATERGGTTAEEEDEGAGADPTPFANLVMFIASPAAAAMGMTEHPSMPPGELDLPLARHCIDLLATVREKTRGNVGDQEQQILESILAELRMQYVSLTSARPLKPPPRGFTGGDITGGR